MGEAGGRSEERNRAGPLRRCPATLAASLLALATLPAATAARTHVAPQDRAATHAYLEAQYRYDRARLSVAPAATTAIEAIGKRLEGECPDVLAGAPRRRVAALLEEAGARRSARRRGEANRQRRQFDDLRLELSFALELPSSELDRQAALVYATAVRPLRWTNPALTAFEHTLVPAVELIKQGAAYDVCADMRAWVGSGYRTLSTATKGLIAQLDSSERALFRDLRSFGFLVEADPLLPYEGASEKAIAARIANTEQALEPFTKRALAATMAAERALGIISQAEAEENEHPRKGSVAIGQGRTAAGRSYTVYVEPKQQHPRPFAAHCSIDVSVEEQEPGSGGRLEVLVIGGGGEPLCVSRAHPAAPTVVCDRGVLKIEAQTLARARRVRLRLSNGRHVTSPVALVPAGLGGPLGFYYQAVRGPSPTPVSLAELDSAGKVLRIVKLPKTERCIREPVKPPPTRTRTVVRGHLPAGASFSIVGERTLGEYSQTNFTTEVESEGESTGGGLLSTISAGNALRPRSPFDRQMQEGCMPSEYAIVFGVLSAPRDTVLVRSGGALRPLTKVRIPGSLHVKGVLAYIALPGVPSEVIVRSPSGESIATERLAGQTREARETCEGEAEGPA